MNQISATPWVLVIDDQDLVRDTICMILDEAGFQHKAVADIESALTVLAHETPRMIITDIFMPGRNGIQGIMEVRERYPTVKIIAVSGSGTIQGMDALEVARRAGADETLPKPFAFEDLIGAVQRLA
ncbi:MAG: hypothetical protein A2516_07195 [Alphaproteobacteria bacterium RIFOXYD12_FULL_60_8]|nr:MAG: hypothetical protein A2516_07195 [Alphaproteobacteria bacterium RIFOXYD12_FULL_60_8]